MKLRYFFISIITVVVVLLLVAGGSFYWILQQSPLKLVRGNIISNPTTAMFVSRQAPLMISLLVNPQQLEYAQQLDSPLSQRRIIHQEAENLKKKLLANTSLNYKKDIDSWLGDEVTLAVTTLDFDYNSKNGVNPGYLLIAKTKDSQRVKEFIQLSLSEQAIAGNSELILEEYKGVKLIYQDTEDRKDNTSLNTTAIAGDYVLFANHPQVLKQAINNVQATNLNLNNDPSYQQALATITEPSIAITYINLPTLSAWLGNEPQAEKANIVQTLTFALSLKAPGITAQTALIGGALEENKAPALSAPVAALQYIPENSIFTVAGENLSQFWSHIATGLAIDSPLQQLLEQAISHLEEPLGLNLPEDIFKWVKGEYTLALVPNYQRGVPDWLFVAEKISTANPEEAIKHLDEIAIAQSLSVGELPLLGQKITTWSKLVTNATEDLTRLEAETKGVHTSVGNYEIFASSLVTIKQALTGTDLLENKQFQQAIAALPSQNDGYFYLEWQKIEKILGEKYPLFKIIELVAQPWLDKVNTFTITSQGSENNIRRATLLVNWK